MKTMNTTKTKQKEEEEEEGELAGRVRNKPRTIEQWIHRHVFSEEQNHIQRGAPELLSKFLEDWEGLCD